MALEDLAMFRAIPTCTVFYPSDAVSTERAVELSANTKVSSTHCDSMSVECPHYDAGQALQLMTLLLGYLFHPHQQTRYCSHLLTWWEIWSGSSQGNRPYTQDSDLKMSYCKKKKSKPKCLYLTRWCASPTAISWPWLALVLHCTRPLLLLTCWPVKVGLYLHLVARYINPLLNI